METQNRMLWNPRKEVGRHTIVVQRDAQFYLPAIQLVYQLYQLKLLQFNDLKIDCKEAFCPIISITTTSPSKVRRRTPEVRSRG